MSIAQLARASSTGIVRGAVAGDPLAVAKGGVECLSESDGGVLGGMVRARVEVAADGHPEVDVTVASEQVEHVVEEADARGAAARTRPFEREGNADVGLTRPALDRGRAAHTPGFSRTRASIDSAWTSKPSARAIGPAAAARRPAAAPIRTSDMRLRKWRGDRPEAKRAAPSVGRTWLEPAT